jgi:hypothetical protein
VKTAESTTKNAVYARSAEQELPIILPPQLEVKSQDFPDEHIGQANFADPWVERAGLFATRRSILCLQPKTLIWNEMIRRGNAVLPNTAYAL